MLQIRLIPLSLIDPPDVAMRSEMDDGDLRAMSANIAKVGLIHPIAVYREGGRYRIAAGHQRYVACQMLGREEIEARDFTDTGIDPQAIKFAENQRRRNVSPADEALWLQEIQEKHHHTLAQLMEITGENEKWISDRLSLFRGDERVYMALKSGELNLGQALELNKYPDDYRLQYLEVCIKSGSPITLLHEWRMQLRQMAMPAAQPESTGPATVAEVTQAGPVLECCAICDSNHASWNMEYRRVHKDCVDQLKRAIAAARKEGIAL